MAELILYGAWGSVSRAIAFVMEEAGIDYAFRLLSFRTGDQLKPEFLAINPKGKVPALIVDGTVLTETVAIFHYLDAAFPGRAILPEGDAMARAQAVADMAWIASGIHPNFPRIYRTARFCDIEGAQERVREQAREMLRAQLDLVEERLQGRAYWYDRQSALDAYIHWIWLLMPSAGIDGAAYPAFAAHAERMAALPSTQRALQREAAPA